MSLPPSILLSFYVSNRYLLFVRARQRRAWAMCGLTRILFEGNWSLFLFYCFYWTLIQYLDLDTNTFFHYFMPAWFDPNIQSNLRWVRVVGIGFRASNEGYPKIPKDFSWRSKLFHALRWYLLLTVVCSLVVVRVSSKLSVALKKKGSEKINQS